MSAEAFRYMIGSMQTGWERQHEEDDLLLLNVGRTWRIGPEPEFLTAWYSQAGLERLDQWEQLFAGDQQAVWNEPFRLAARMDAAGCYEPLVEPRVGTTGRYYAEYFDFVPDASRDDVKAFYLARAGRHSGARALAARRPARDARPRSARPGRVELHGLGRPRRARSGARRRRGAGEGCQRSAVRGPRPRDPLTLRPTTRRRNDAERDRDHPGWAAPAPRTTRRPCSPRARGRSRSAARSRTREDGSVVGGDDAYEQARECLRRIDQLLSAAGAAKTDVVRVASSSPTWPTGPR